ncbi:MAG: sodium:proton antiporter NhaD [Candidatus Saccharimonadales bacterium]
MDAIGFIAAGIFVLGYALITMEQKFGTHKSAIALTVGGVLWVLAAVSLRGNEEALDHAIAHTGSEIFSIVAFLLAAMALIEILVHFRLFDLMRYKLIRMKVNDQQQFLIILTVTFFFSAILDNIAITIAMLQIARRFFEGHNMFIAAAGIVVAANAGGAWSPIGDITTILLWLGDKFTAMEVIRYAFLPSLALFVVVTALLYRKLDRDSFIKREQGDMEPLSRSEKLVIATALGSFTLPLLMSFVGLPPYIGLLFGLGITWGVIELVRHRMLRLHTEQQTHMSANIEKLVQTVDISSVKYLMGILLAVGALASIGVLYWLSQVVVGDSASVAQLIGINMGIGVVSGVVDNASLVAIAMNTLPMTDPELWSLTAVAAGNGGSLMVIASAAGVVAMGNYKQLTVGKYLKVATLPVLLGLAVSFAVWLVQFKFF